MSYIQKVKDHLGNTFLYLTGIFLGICIASALDSFAWSMVALVGSVLLAPIINPLINKLLIQIPKIIHAIRYRPETMVTISDGTISIQIPYKYLSGMDIKDARRVLRAQVKGQFCDKQYWRM